MFHPFLFHSDPDAGFPSFCETRRHIHVTEISQDEKRVLQKNEGDRLLVSDHLMVSDHEYRPDIPDH